MTRLLRRTRFTGVSEDDHQGALPVALELEGFGFEREVRLDERNRIDFLVTRDTEEVGIEVKITSRSKSAVYAQVRRYAACGLSELVLVAPWSAVPDFEVDGSRVMVVDPSKRAV